jgi:putative transcriptional regulator
MKNGFVLKNRVRELRSRLKLRQSDLAREVDVTRQTILAIEKGRLNPSIMVSLKLSRVLREPVDYIFYLDRGGDALTQAAARSAAPREVREPAPEEAEKPRAIFDLG